MAGNKSKANILKTQPDSFWERLFIFPKVIRNGTSGRDHLGLALSRLEKCGRPNLLLLCERAGIEVKKDASASQLAAVLRAADKGQTHVFLAEFLRQKGAAINEEYGVALSQRERSKRNALLAEAGGRSRATLKQFTKLLLLYEDDPASLKRILYRQLWRNKDTTYEYQSDRIIDDRFSAEIQKNAESLAVEFESSLSGLGVRYVGATKLGSRLQVLLFQQEHRAITRADYRNKPVTFRGFGWITVGLHGDTDRIVLKGGGSHAVETVRKWFEQVLTVDLQRAGAAPFVQYEPAEVERRLLGEYADDSKLQISGMRFKRSLTPSHAPIAIEPAFEGDSIRRDLKWAADHGVVRVRSLSDIDWIKLAFNAREVKIDVEAERRGAVTFRLNNELLTEEDDDSIREEFQKTFGFPLNTHIDPQLLKMGPMEVYNYILEAERREQIIGYQKQSFEELESLGLVRVVSRAVKVCRNGLCKLKDKVVENPESPDCVGCQNELGSKTVQFLEHADDEIRKKSGKIISAALSWKFSHQASKFEKQDLYPLVDPSRPDEVVRVYFADRVSVPLLKKFDRSMLPVLVVHTKGQVEHAHLDAAGIAHVGFAYALAAERDKDTQDLFKRDLKEALTTLLRRGQIRVLRAAEASRGVLTDIPADEKEYLGDHWANDVFNVLRSIFPYSEKWGGGDKPDGFCSLVYFEGGKLKDVRKFNWSYDAKFTREDEGYDLGSGEKRKMFDYVSALMEQPSLQTQGNGLDAHVILTNNVAESTMRSCADFLRREHRLGNDHAPLHLVFMFDRFLLRLYDTVRANEDRFLRRWAHLASRLASLMAKEGADKYAKLDESDANALTMWVLKQPEIETPPDISLIKQGLAETMTKS